MKQCNNYNNDNNRFIYKVINIQSKWKGCQNMTYITISLVIIVHQENYIVHKNLQLLSKFVRQAIGDFLNRSCLKYGILNFWLLFLVLIVLQFLTNQCECLGFFWALIANFLQSVSLLSDKLLSPVFSKAFSQFSQSLPSTQWRKTF